jgi:hypothetical protein
VEIPLLASPKGGISYTRSPKGYLRLMWLDWIQAQARGRAAFVWMPHSTRSISHRAADLEGAIDSPNSREPLQPYITGRTP